LEKGQSGQFDVLVDGQLIFSRFETGRFPEFEEILPKLEK
jgi:selT/selW/selH-like putative selenoprotein